MCRFLCEVDRIKVFTCILQVQCPVLRTPISGLCELGMLCSKPGWAGTRMSLSFSVAVSPWWLMLSTKRAPDQVFSLVYRVRWACSALSFDNAVTISGCCRGPRSPYGPGVSPRRRQRVFRDRSDPMALPENILYERSSGGIPYLIVLVGPCVDNA